MTFLILTNIINNKMSLKLLTLYQAKLLLQRTKFPKLLSFDLGKNSTGIAVSNDDLTQAYVHLILFKIASETCQKCRQ